MNATISTQQVDLEIYSPGELDFWKMARLFIDAPIKSRPNNKKYKLKGFIVYPVSPNQALSKKINLIPLFYGYHMLIYAKNKPVKSISIKHQ